MTWSDHLIAYLKKAGATYTYACLHTVDGTSCFAEDGSKYDIKPCEVAAAVNKSVTDTVKTSGLTLAGVKYPYLSDQSGVFCCKKKEHNCFFFSGSRFTFVVFTTTDPRIFMSKFLIVKDALAGAGLV